MSDQSHSTNPMTPEEARQVLSECLKDYGTIESRLDDILERLPEPAEYNGMVLGVRPLNLAGRIRYCLADWRHLGSIRDPLMEAAAIGDESAVAGEWTSTLERYVAKIEQLHVRWKLECDAVSMAERLESGSPSSQTEKRLARKIGALWMLTGPITEELRARVVAVVLDQPMGDELRPSI